MITPFDGPIRGGFFLHGLVKPTGTGGAAQLHRSGHAAQDWPKSQLTAIDTPGSPASKQWGDAYAVRRPGWTAPALTPEQIADDASAGREFLDYGIGSHVSPVPRWVAFCAADNSRWAIELQDLGGNNVRIAASRFGTFGAPQQTILGPSMALGSLTTGHTKGQPVPLPDGSAAVVPMVKAGATVSPVTEHHGGEQMRMPVEWHRVSVTINKVDGIYSVSSSAAAYLSSAETAVLVSQETGDTFVRTAPPVPTLNFAETRVYTGDILRSDYVWDLVTNPAPGGSGATSGSGWFERVTLVAFAVWINAAGEFETLWCRTRYRTQRDALEDALITRGPGAHTEWNYKTGAIVSQSTTSYVAAAGVYDQTVVTLECEILAGESSLFSETWTWTWSQVRDTEKNSTWRLDPKPDGGGTYQATQQVEVINTSPTYHEEALEKRGDSTIYTGASTFSGQSWIGMTNVTTEETLGSYPVVAYMHGVQPDTAGMAGAIVTPDAVSGTAFAVSYPRRTMMVRPYLWSSGCVGLVEVRSTYTAYDAGRFSWHAENGWAYAFPAFAPDHSSDGVTIAQQRLSPYWLVLAPYQWGDTDYIAGLGTDPQYPGGPMSSHFLRAVRSAHPGTHAITTSTTEPHDYA